MFEKVFGLHEVAKPYGWYRVAGDEMTLCHCREGYFAFDNHGYLHTVLVAETPDGVLKWVNDEDDKTEGN